MQLAHNLQPIEIAFAVTHDLVRTVTLLFRMGALPIAWMHVLSLPSHSPAEREIGLKDFPRVADRSTLWVHQFVVLRGGRPEAAIEVGIFSSQHADGARMKGASPVLL